MIDINQQVEMAQEVGSQDGVLHVHDNEGTLEGPVESQVQAAGSRFTMGRNRGLLVTCREGPVEG